MQIRYPILMCLGLLAAAQANAAGFFENMAVRGGIGAGQLNLNGNGFDGHSAGWNIFTGFEFNRYLAVEIGRLEGGGPSQDILLTPTTLGTDEIHNFSWHGSVLGSWPINDAVSVYGRAGMLSWHATEQIRSGGITVASGPPSTGNDVLLGGGLAVNVDSGLFRLEYDRTKILDVDTTYISVSFVWRFRL